ncbi:MAG: ATP-binding protein [Acidimicrobiales bacterium]
MAEGTPGRPESGTAPLPVAERRLCSILFVDLVGFTPLSESKDPEEVREILSSYFDVARRTISRYGGIVEKFIGDAVMAVWGTPVAQEGDTERAVRAALDLVDAVRVLGAEVAAPGLAARAGVVTGEVAVTLGAQGEGMVAGDAVNTAARVQSVARPGTVFVDGATRRLSEPAVSFRAEGAFELKGKSETEQLFSAARVVSRVGGGQWAEGPEAPLTGRDAELRTVKDLFHTAAERRTPRLVVVTGPAGVGKSRLGWEFEKYIDGLADTVLWHRGRCLSYGEGVAFWALAEIVRQRFGIAEEDPKATATAKLTEGLVRFVQDDEERDYVGVRLSRLLGVPYASEARAVLSQDELYAGWRLFFEHLAAVAPVVLVIEDAQHADRSLLGFFEHLIDWSRELPIFVLLFARPGHEAIDAGYGVGRNRSTLSLDPLDAASMASLVEGLVPGMPDGARGAIAARAQGIPLFAVETVRSLLDQGVVEKDGTSYRLVGDLGTLRVPDSLHGLLAARLDALGADARALVADASVVGRSFPEEALVAVSNMVPDAVHAGIAELVRRDVLEVIADPLSPERGSYRFSQEMLRQVAYETLSKKDRKARHLAVAAHLREAFGNEGEEIADAIAHHYLDALAANPADVDAEEIQGSALDFLARAATRASRSGAPARAAQLYAQAAEIAPPARSPHLLDDAAKMAEEAGDYEIALVHAQAAHERYVGLADRRSAARAESFIGLVLGRLGRHGAARDALGAALAILREVPDADTVAALMYLAGVEAFSGNATLGERLITEALHLAQATGVATRELAQLFTVKGIVAGMASRHAEAAADLRESARLAERAGDFGALARAQLNLADVLLKSEPVAAADAARSAVLHGRRTGQRDVLGVAEANLATALIDLGEWDDAADVLRHALDADRLDHAYLHAIAGWLAGLRGDRAGAAAAQEVVARFPETEDLQDQAIAGVLVAFVAFAATQPADALEQLSGVLETGEVLGIGADTMRWAWLLAARAARDLGAHETLGRLIAVLDAHPTGHLPRILRAERQLVGALVAAEAVGSGDASAVAAVADAVDSLRDAGNPYQLAHGLVDFAEVLVRAGEDGADAALAEARGIGERLGCPPLVARASAAGSRFASAESSH